MVSTRYTLEAQKDKVIGVILGGMPLSEVARQFHVSRTAIRSFRIRHADVLVPAKEALIAATVDLWIADEHVRQEKRQELYEDMEASKKALPERAGMTRATMAKTQAGILNDAGPSGTNVTIDNRIQVLVREVRGIEVPLG